MNKKLLRLIKFPLFLFFYSKKRNEGGEENFGDILSLYLVKRISKRPVFLINPSRFLFRNLISHYFVIGSILSRSNKNSIIWGSGIIRKNENIKGGTFLAVRGPKTRDRIISLGFKCDEVYGDPAILTPLFYNPEKNTSNNIIGVIPHYVDYDKVFNIYKDKPNFKVIDLLNSNVEAVVKEILSCNKIISSSLHGVIISHAYNIPALWVKFSNKLVGDDIKFQDYFESVSIEYKKVFELEDCIDLENLFEINSKIILPKVGVISSRQEKLLSVCPF